MTDMRTNKLFECFFFEVLTIRKKDPMQAQIKKGKKHNAIYLLKLSGIYILKLYWNDRFDFAYWIEKYFLIRYLQEKEKNYA